MRNGSGPVQVEFCSVQDVKGGNIVCTTAEMVAPARGGKVMLLSVNEKLD